MKRFIVFLGAIMLVLSFTTASMAGWDKCKGCHNGTVAPSAEQLKGKFNTAEEVVAAAKASQNAMMKPMQNDDVLKAAAEELMAAPAAEPAPAE